MFAAGQRRDRRGRRIKEEAGRRATAWSSRCSTTSAGPACTERAVDRENLARVVAQIRRTGLFGSTRRCWSSTRRVADEIVRAEIERLPTGDDRALRLERMVVGTVAFGEVLAILRRLGEAHHSAVRAGVASP